MIQENWLSEQRERINSPDVREAFDLLLAAARGDDRYLLERMKNGSMPTARYSRLPKQPRERRPAFAVNENKGLLFYSQLTGTPKSVGELCSAGYEVSLKDDRIRIRINNAKDARFALEHSVETWLQFSG